MAVAEWAGGYRAAVEPRAGSVKYHFQKAASRLSRNQISQLFSAWKARGADTRAAASNQERECVGDQYAWHRGR